MQDSKSHILFNGDKFMFKNAKFDRQMKKFEGVIVFKTKAKKRKRRSKKVFNNKTAHSAFYTLHFSDDFSEVAHGSITYFEEMEESDYKRAKDTDADKDNKVLSKDDEAKGIAIEVHDYLYPAKYFLKTEFIGPAVQE